MELRYQDCSKSQTKQARVIGELLSGREGTSYLPEAEGRCAFSPDESRFAWSCGFRKVVLIPWNRYKNCLQSKDNRDLAGNSVVTEEISIDCSFQVCSLAFGVGVPDREFRTVKKQYWTRFDFSQDLTLATGHGNGRIRIWDPYTGKLLLELTDHKLTVNSLAFAHDGSLRLASASQDGTIKIWDLSDDGNMFKTLVDEVKSPFKNVTWSPSSKMLCSVGVQKKALLWNMEKYNLHKKLFGHVNDVNACSFSPDGALVATASSDTKVIIWYTTTGNILRIINHLNPPPASMYLSGMNDHFVRGVSFSPNGCQISSTCADGILRFWNLMSGEEEPEEIGLGIANDAMLSCHFSPGGGTVAVSYASGSSIFYNTPKRVVSLLHMCRMSVRKALVSSNVEETLFLPRTLYRYLRYE